MRSKHSKGAGNVMKHFVNELSVPIFWALIMAGILAWGVYSFMRGSIYNHYGRYSKRDEPFRFYLYTFLFTFVPLVAIILIVIVFII